MHETMVWDIGAIDPDDRARFGGKATGLARMVVAGVAVPPAFVVSTDAFAAFRGAKALSSVLRDEMGRALSRLEHASGRRFGGTPPLLVSVRSGAAVSMPGMMDTVLNLGLDAPSAHRLAVESGDVAFVIDTWVRFWGMYAEIVLGGDAEELKSAVAEAARGAADAASFERLEQAFVDAVGAQGLEGSRDPRVQLEQATLAVFQSWDSRRARAYRDHHQISHDLGTTVTIQAMVFGNRDARSGTGVAFSRNPNSGEPQIFGEFLAGGQGEDLVSGAVTPADLSSGDGLDGDVHAELTSATRRLERVYRDALDIEITVEAGKLYFLQVRPAKRTAVAAVRIALDLLDEGIITADEALKLVSVAQVERLLTPTFDVAALAAAPVLAKGIGSSPGNAAGVAVLDADRAAERAGRGEAVVLLRPTTSPLDIRGMLAAVAIVTARGGALSHAAVVSRALDKPCVVGCEAIEVDPAARTFRIAGRTFQEGAPISVDGATGRVHEGLVAVTSTGTGGAYLERLLRLADERSGADFRLAAPDEVWRDAASPTICQSLYEEGCRKFSTSAASAAGLRLLLGQVAGEVVHG